ncbi:TPA: hypothetical protein SLH21_001053 [Morganella morganii]|uniref:hypothetical protein n=1 Tax=Morganella morganii TaxID=582 RepID=UPI0029C4CAB7|nr:hypothetical protein [Morganella morganii]
MESEYGFLEREFENIVSVLKGMNKDDFVLGVRSILKNENNIDDGLIKRLLKCIEDVTNLIEENKVSISSVCKISNKNGPLSYADDTVGRVSHLLWVYIVLVRFLYEYMYNISNSYSIERITYAISDFEKFDLLYNNIINDDFYYFYLNTRKVYIYRVICNHNNELSSRVNNLDNYTKKVESALASNEYISSRLDKFDFFEDEKYSKFEKKLTGITEDLETRVDEKVKEIKEIKDIINDMNDSVTFMGLDNAYKKIHDEKIIEKKNALRVLWVSVFFVFLPLVIKICVSLFKDGYESSIYDYGLTVTGTVIFIYYFRVALLNYNSIKTELMQVKLRRSLCMFINMYVDFSKRNDNPESLSKFESLIFSNIIPDDKRVPSTLDGIEQIAKLINSLKSK